jgi:uncharacterized protein YuzE
VGGACDTYEEKGNVCRVFSRKYERNTTHEMGDNIEIDIKEID